MHSRPVVLNGQIFDILIHDFIYNPSINVSQIIILFENIFRTPHLLSVKIFLTTEDDKQKKDR